MRESQKVIFVLTFTVMLLFSPTLTTGYAQESKELPVMYKKANDHFMLGEYHQAIEIYDEILDIFWEAHDPTTLNRQGNDRGTQYRSAIYYQGENQKLAVQKSIKKAEKLFDDPITTEVKELDKFYVAEGYHQDYFENNPNAPYCTFIIAPKINKLRKKGTIWEE